MRFAFTDDQLAFRDAVRDLLEKECPPAAVRDAWTNATGRTAGAWDALREMGVLGVCAPEAHGGLGLGFVDLVLLLEESGRCGLPEPIVETAAVAVTLVPDAITGAATVVAPETPYAAWADTASVVLLVDDDTVLTVDPTDAVFEPRPSVDGARRPFWVDAGTTTEIGGRTEAAAAFDRGALGVAAQQCGLADRMLDLTVEYAKERKQFGAAIGSFQAVKHHLANARLHLEFARPLVYRAAYSITYGSPDAPLHVSMAKANADRAALTTARAALQCHGAIGYTTEHDLHLFMKRAWALARTWGDAAWHRRRVTGAIL